MIRRQWFFLLALLAAFSVIPSAYYAKVPRPTASWSGYLMDLACGRDRRDKDPDLGPNHTRKCLQMPTCDQSGFGLLTDTNELVPFDENGNRQVRALLAKTSRRSNFRILGRGTKSDHMLRVDQIKLAPDSLQR
jgi:hypothetical protein